MGRLIDADRMINELGISDRDIYCKCLIDEQPTAFDVEAVVKELEEMTQIEIANECPMECICGNCEWSKYKCDGCYTGRAIEIVRKGGVK